MRWTRRTRFDPQGAALADKHYSRKTIGSDQFMPSGKALVLVTEDGDAVWGSSWQLAADGTSMAFHAWPRAWVCSIFRNESAHLSSELIREALAVTRYEWGNPTDQGMVTFVDADKVRPKRDPGRCFIRAGFKRVGETGSGKVALQILEAAMPEAEPAIGTNRTLFAPVTREVSRRRTHPGGPLEDIA